MATHKPTTKQQLGRRGEELAAASLSEKGYTLVARNYRSRRLELDLVFVIEHTLVICEVKSLHASPLGAPEYRVHAAKRRHMIRAAWTFLEDHPEYESFDVRFDVIIVDFSRYPARIRHHIGAFEEE